MKTYIFILEIVQNENEACVQLTVFINHLNSCSWLEANQSKSTLILILIYQADVDQLCCMWQTQVKIYQEMKTTQTGRSAVESICVFWFSLTFQFKHQRHSFYIRRHKNKENFNKTCFFLFLLQLLKKLWTSKCLESLVNVRFLSETSQR